MAPIPMPPADSDPMGMGAEGMPDLSHLSEEERQIILQVLQRQKAEEQQEEEIAQKGDKELWDIERQIQEKKENAQRLIGTQDDAICQICQKTKFADGIGHKCFYCQLRSCARCGGKTTSKNKNIWACSLCQKRQQILARTGKWFQQPQKEQQGQIGATTANSPSPVNPMPPSPMVEENEMRKPSLPQKTSISQSSPVALSPSGLNRQGSLRRQSSLEDPQQMPTMNGEKMQQTPRANGQMRKASGNQREGGGGELQRQRSIRQQQQQSQQQQMGRQQSAPQHLQSTSSHSPRLLPSIEDHPSSSSTTQNSLHNQRPSTAGQIGNRSKEAGGQQQHRQRSMEDGHPNRQSSRPDHPQHRRPPTSSSASSTPFVPAVPGQQPPPPPPPPTSSRQSSTAAPQIGAGPSPMRNRRAKAGSRQTMHQQPPPQPHRSYSSSDDELSSPKQQNNSSISQPQGGGGLPQSASLQLESTNTKLEPDFSEKELLRYIYDNSHPNAKKAAASNRGGPFFGQQAHSLDATATMTNAKMSSGMATAAPSTMASANSPSHHNILAQRIRNYLSNPSVSWQPSPDQRHLVGHIVLYKPHSLALMNLPNSSTAQGFNSLDFGLKVVGGRNPSNGRLGAFVSRVRPGSLADTVGQLRAGDEVLKWNGHSLQNLTPEGVYNIVQSTKGDSRLELIVSRPIAGDADDFLNLRRLRDHQELGGSTGIGPQAALPHSQSMSAAASTSPFANNFAYNQMQQRYPPQHSHSRRAPSPLVLHAGGGTFFDAMPVNMPPPMAFPSSSSTDADPRICGRMEMALLYLAQKKELIISLSRAYDLVPRPDANPLRNPYVKIFLLPDRSEKSRRQSKILSETLNPIWDEHFFYEDLDEVGLAGRVLEITLWDYDPYESHSFLGEALVEMGQAPLNNQPFLYNLLDMDEENPIRMRLRQRRYSSMTPPVGHRSRSQMSYSGTQTQPQHSSFGNNNNYNERRKISDNYGNTSHSIHNLPFHASRHRGAGFPLTIGNEAFWQTAEEDWNRNGGDEDWSQIGGGWTKRGGGGGGKVPNGYLSDQEQEWEMERRRRDRGGGEHHRRKEHRHQHHRSGGERGNGGRGAGGEHRRPQSATALRNIAEWELRHNNSNGGGGNYDEPPEGGVQNNGKANRKTTRQQILKEQEVGGTGGYGSDGSVETLSVNSAQSMQNRALLRQQQIQRIRDQQQMQISHQSSNEEMDPRGQLVVEDEEEIIGMDRMMMQAGQGGQKGGQGLQMSVKEMKERKKSLMTRLIPGRNGPNDANKRLGFARSEEVGIPLEAGTALAPPEQNRDFIKQNSKESTDSSDNWLPILPDRPLGSFMDNLGPGQVVGRQALGSSPLGELHVGLAVETGNGLIVDVKEAKGLKATGPKGMAPATYVKAYLMDGKNCVAKAKTPPSKSRSASPSFRQKLVFGENPRNKMLQLTVIGDFGRMERKSFMGVAQIALDEIQLGREQMDGWYKLFHSASLNGSAQPPGSTNSAGNGGGGGGPSRKESEVSLN